MKKVLIDTNVVLDVLLDRQPHFRTSAAVWDAIADGKAEGAISAHAVTTVHYLVAGDRGQATARHALGTLLGVFNVATVDQTIIHEAINSPSADFEDAVTAAAAHAAGCDFIVTRDPKGFRGSPVRAMSPEAVLPLLAG